MSSCLVKLNKLTSAAVPHSISLSICVVDCIAVFFLIPSVFPLTLI
jgi:hypothetical protein